MPSEGPCRTKSKNRCNLGVKAYRERKTGPQIALCVVHCKTHDAHFTLYPPGHVPHGRTAVVELTLSGEEVKQDRGPPFTGTMFQAALDGEQGIAWPKESEEGSRVPRFETQKRHLTRCCSQLSIIAKNNWEKAADALKVARIVLKEASEQLSIDKGYRMMSSCICSIIREIPPTIQTFLGLASCGYYAGIWPKIQWWDESVSRYRRIPFRTLE